jgi:hypothetical protein
VTILFLIGTYAYDRNEPGPTFGLTALGCTALAAWLTGAVLAGEPPAQHEMASVALGGRRALDLLLVVAVALLLTVLFVGYPLLLSATVIPHEFAPRPKPHDIEAAILAQLCCGFLGGALGVLFAPPRVTRRATAAAAVASTLLALIALSRPLHALGGPAALAQQLTKAHAGTIRPGVVPAALSCLALAAAALLGAARWAERSG